jgi:hypothetical protein
LRWINRGAWPLNRRRPARSEAPSTLEGWVIVKRTFWVGLALGFLGAAGAAAAPSHDMAGMGCHGMRGMHDGGHSAAGHAMPHRGGMGVRMMGMMGSHGSMQGMHGHGMNHQTPTPPAPSEQDRTPQPPRHRH